MRRENDIAERYFDWMYNLVCGGRFADGISYKRLIRHLHNTEFTWTLPRDVNRSEDGKDLRYRFAYNTGCACADSHLEGPCSVLEMMVALSIRCEESIMDDPQIGDRTAQWFWKMITNLGLGSMVDDHFDLLEAKDILNRFLNREYEPNGTGGLFTIRGCTEDLRTVEIWYQLCWYLDSIT
jgi:hypothetical protein